MVVSRPCDSDRNVQYEAPENSIFLFNGKCCFMAGYLAQHCVCTQRIARLSSDLAAAVQLPESKSTRNIVGWLTQPDVTALSAKQSRLVFVAAATRMPAELSWVSKQ